VAGPGPAHGRTRGPGAEEGFDLGEARLDHRYCLFVSSLSASSRSKSSDAIPTRGPTRATTTLSYTRDALDRIVARSVGRHRHHPLRLCRSGRQPRGHPERKTNYARPELGLATAATVDPAGANLVTTTDYEAPGAFFRPKRKTLPAGNATTYDYYGEGTTPASADNPCPGGASGVNQGGALAKRTTPARVESFVYDAAGRAVASRVGTESWSCATYDARGRPVTKTTPASAAEPAGRSVTYDYAVGGDPATTSVSDPAGTITTATDWLGRVTSYTAAWAKTTTTTYDQAGRVTRTVGPAATMAASYDPTGRVAAQSLDGAEVATAT
jgi:YD repeat-containing protein